MIKTGIKNLNNTLTDKQYKYIKNTSYRLRDKTVLPLISYIKTLIDEGYTLTEGSKNSFIIRNKSLSIVLNAVEAKLFFHINNGAEGIVKANGLSEYKIY